MKEVVAVSLKPVTEASSLGKSASDGGRLLVQVILDIKKMGSHLLHIFGVMAVASCSRSPHV